VTDKTDFVPPNGPDFIATRSLHMQGLLKHVPSDEIPKSEDLFSGEALERHLKALGEPPLSLVAGGDIMLGGRTNKVVAEYGPDYPLAAVLPILRRASLVLGNLEGPFARKAQRERKNYSYRVKVELAHALARARIQVVTLANNHLLDCGPAGVLETLDVLADAGVVPLGAGADENAAHAAVIRQVGRRRIGFLGYYWNRRCAATAALPGSAMDSREALETDICGLRGLVDRVVVTFHWGIPYEREPSPEDRAKAHFAVDCGADVVVGHHPHIVQPFEIYRGCPIFYSVGNFAFGSGNSRAEGLLVGFRFKDTNTLVDVCPLYVKNRDPRVHYQPKLVRGDAAARQLRRLVEISGPSGEFLKLEGWRGRITLPRPGLRHKRSKEAHA
jgi:poly-gamma-glutamate capsule biosynthesis protein CapA/YwtB (metallophosphatase superfamily)